MSQLCSNQYMRKRKVKVPIQEMFNESSFHLYSKFNILSAGSPYHPEEQCSTLLLFLGIPVNRKWN